MLKKLSNAITNVYEQYLHKKKNFRVQVSENFVINSRKACLRAERAERAERAVRAGNKV